MRLVDSPNPTTNINTPHHSTNSKQEGDGGGGDSKPYAASDGAASSAAAAAAGAGAAGMEEEGEGETAPRRVVEVPAEPPGICVCVLLLLDCFVVGLCVCVGGPSVPIQ